MSVHRSCVSCIIKSNSTDLLLSKPSILFHSPHALPTTRSISRPQHCVQQVLPIFFVNHVTEQGFFLPCLYSRDLWNSLLTLFPARIPRPGIWQSPFTSCNHHILSALPPAAPLSCVSRHGGGGGFVWLLRAWGSCVECAHFSASPNGLVDVTRRSAKVS